MTKKSSKLISKIFSWIYYIGAALMIVAIIASFVSSSFLGDLTVELEKQGIDFGDMDTKIAITFVYGFTAAIMFVIGWLFSRVAKGKSNGLILLVLLGLSAVSSIITLFKSITISNCISLVITLIALLAVYTARKK